MKKKNKIIIIITIVFLLGFLFLPVIPDKYIFMTKIQKEKQEKFCEDNGCGLLILISPYEYLKKSIYNLVIRN